MIGPHWYYSLVFFVTVNVLVSVGISALSKRVWVVKWALKVGLVLWDTVDLILILTDTGIEKRGESHREEWLLHISKHNLIHKLCQKCNLILSEGKSYLEHCDICNSCFTGHDVHSKIVGKCIGAKV